MFSSLRTTLLAWQTLLLVAVVAGFGGVLFARVRHATLEQVDADLLGAAQVLATQRQQQDSAPLAIPEAYLRRFGPGPKETPYFVVLDADGQRLSESPNAPRELPPIKHPPLKKPHPIHARDRGDSREVIVFGDNAEVLVGRSIQRERDHLQRLLRWVIAAGAGVLSVGLLGAWWLARRIAVPMERMTAAAERISASNLSERLPVPASKSEVTRLGNVLNQTFARLQAAFERQTRFTADASHELRTPVSVVLFQSELALSKPRTSDEYQESLQACQRSAQRMKSLVDDLLTLARADAGQLCLKLAPVELQPLVHDAIELLRPTAEQRRVTISCELQPITVHGDADRLTQVVCNLLSNAIRYNRDPGRVDVSLTSENDEAILRVTDTGIGIAEADIPKLFDRFFRADVARTDDGGTGLGLAICREIVLAHGGHIHATSQPGAGSTFTVRWPKPAVE